MTTKPADPMDAELLVDRISPRLSHSNSGVVIAAVRAIFYLSSYSNSAAFVENAYNKCAPPLSMRILI